MEKQTEKGSGSPLAGLTVIEIGTSVAGPFAGQVLADLGAEVIKVENPAGGDDARQWGPPFVDDVATVFYTLNRNKKSIAVDFKDERALARLRRLITERSDIVLQNMRPGLVARFGIDASLVEDNPRLIYCDIGAYGSVGPLREKPGYDPLMQAFTGLMSVTGEEGRLPVRVGTSIVDMGAGMWAVIGILAAVHRRSLTGRGGFVETSLLETAVTWMSTHVASYLATGTVPGRVGSEHVSLAPYKAFEAADGYLVVAVGNDRLFERLCGALGIPEIAADTRFLSNPDRVRNRVVLNQMLDDILRRRTRAEWLELLERVGVPCAPLQNVEEALRDEQIDATGILQEVPDAPQSVVGIPLKFDGERSGLRSRAPGLGAQNDDIFGDACGERE